METNNLILLEQFCIHHNIEFEFINSLLEFSLIDVVVIEDNRYLRHEKLKDVEKMINYYYDLGINMEGIDVISNLLNQIVDLKEELKITKNKLQFFDEK